MSTFLIALSNVLITLLYLLPGFVLKKAGKASEEHLSTLSAILIYVGTPVLEISAFLSIDYTAESLKYMGLFFLATMALQAAFMFLLFLACGRLYEHARYRVLTIASVMGNVGFFGIPIVRAILPNAPEAVCYATVYMVSMNVLVFTVGVYFLTRDRRYISLKNAFLNPTVIGFAIAFPCYLFGLGAVIPEQLRSAITLVGSMTTPLCMMILGVRLASAPLRRIFSEPLVYLVAGLKLLIFPLFCYGVLLLLPLPETFRATALILSGTPCAAVILSLSELHRTEASFPANVLLVSTLFCFLTIPLLTLLL